MFKGFYLLVILALFNTKAYPQQIFKNTDSVLDSLKQEWKKDSLGLLGYRQKCMNDIIKVYHFTTGSDFIKTFGQPNYTRIRKGDTTATHRVYTTYRYFISCIEGKNDRDVFCSCILSLYCDKNDNIIYKEAPSYEGTGKPTPQGYYIE